MTREEKMLKRREEGKTYKYKPNPFKKGTKEYNAEAAERKAKKSGRLEYAKITSIFAKLEHNMQMEALKRKKYKEEIKKNSKVTA